MIVDIAVAVVLLVSAGIAFLRGFVREVLTIAGVVGGLVAAWYGQPYLLPSMRSWLGIVPDAEPQKLFDIISYDLLADILSYGSIFVSVGIVLSIISHILAETVRGIGLGAIDRTLGVMFGLVRGIVLLGLLYTPAYLFVEQDVRHGWFEGSRTHFYIEKTAGLLSLMMPDGTVSVINSVVDQNFQDEQSNAAQKALKDIDLLPKNSETTLPKSEERPDSGYNDEFRQHMDQLFENGQLEMPLPEESKNIPEPKYNQ